MKKNKKHQKVWGFTLLELMVVIVIIGLVATMTLVVIYTSKNRAKKARIVSNLDQIRKAAELFYNSNNYSYMGLGDAPGISILGEDMSWQGGQLNVSPDSDSYVAYSAYPGAETGHYWCVDDKGNSQDVGYVPGSDCKSAAPAPTPSASPSTLPGPSSFPRETSIKGTGGQRQ
ncbi:MAG: hypothetical protein UT37_C0006G0029 [Parcubacteria group bacterium GW2011_GWA2_39_18]|nr:MAG: hypothetical protein UT37_C0006G0029 [Parcubacteria group bacterium GW2011_GWA2_39_18]